MPLNVFWSILWKRISVRERNIKLLLEAVTYMATREIATCIITIEIVMCIMHCRKYHLHDCSRDSHLYNFNKNCHPRICCRNFHLYKCCRNFQTLDNRNPDLRTCIIAIERVSFIVSTETATYRIDCRNFHLQKWYFSKLANKETDRYSTLDPNGA